jgi:ribosomal protein S19
MKIPFVDYSLYTSVITSISPLESSNNTSISSKSVILTKSRSSVIVDDFIGKVISVYNGKLSKRVKIKEGMAGHLLGEFSITKKIGKSIHNSERNRKKKEKMRRKITQKKVRKPSNSVKTKKK